MVSTDDSNTKKSESISSDSVESDSNGETDSGVGRSFKCKYSDVEVSGHMMYVIQVVKRITVVILWIATLTLRSLTVAKVDYSSKNVRVSGYTMHVI